MLGLDLTALKSYAECGAVDVQEVGCLSEIHPPFCLLPLRGVAGDLVIRSQRCDPFFCPSVTTACPQTVPGENARDHFIGTNACQNPHSFHKILWGLRAILTASPTAHLQLSMDTAFPVNGQDECALVRIYICDNLMDQCPHDAFFQPNIGVGAIPNRFQITGQPLKLVFRRSNECSLLSIVLIDPLLYVLQTSERLIPSPFQLVGNQAIFGVCQIILFLCTVSCVACCLPFSFPRLQDLVVLLVLFFCSYHRSFDCCRLHHAYNLARDRLVYG